jgi:hypothetical protein
MRNHGVAGLTFKDHTLRVTHIVQRRGEWIPEVFKEANGRWVRDEAAQYIESEKRPHPRYRSFVAVAIMATAAECVGVLCLDSTNVRTFDPVDIRHLIESLCGRLRAVIAIHERLIQLDAPPGTMI